MDKKLTLVVLLVLGVVLLVEASLDSKRGHFLSHAVKLKGRYPEKYLFGQIYWEDPSVQIFKKDQFGQIYKKDPSFGQIYKKDLQFGPIYNEVIQKTFKRTSMNYVILI